MFLSRLFKRKSTKLLTLFGALTMALGVGATLSALNAVNPLETDAWTFGGESIYIAVKSGCFASGNHDEKYAVCFQDGDGKNEKWSSAFTKFRDGNDGYEIYKGTLPTSSVVGKFFLIRYNATGTPSWTSKWNQYQLTSEEVSSFSADANNCFKFSSYDGGEWQWCAGNSGKTMYADLGTSWGLSSASTVKVHYWDDVSEGDINPATNQKSGLYRFYSATLPYNYKFLWYCENYVHQTGNLSVNDFGSNNAYLLDSNSKVSTNGTVRTVTLKTKKGTGDPINYRTDYLFDGLSYELPSLPSPASGYAAASAWSANPDGTSPYSSGWISGVTDDTIAYAYYSPQEYTITYKDQGNTTFTGTHATGYPTSYTYGIGATLLSASKTGYNFDGWFNNSACTGTAVTSISSTSTGAKTFYAKWTANTYSVTLDKQSGTGGTSNITATYGSAMPSATMPTREGYTFRGYYTGTNGSGTQYYAANGSSARNWAETTVTTLYANWDANAYIIRIRPVLDGVRQSHFESDSLAISASGAHTFSEYESVSTWTNFIYGYSFEGFYQTLGDDGKLSNPLSGSYLSGAPWEGGNQYAFAKYVRLSTNKTFYCYAPNTSALTGEGTISVRYWKTKDTSGADSFFPGVRLVAQPGVASMYSFSIPADATSFMINNGNSEKESLPQCQTVTLYTGSGSDETTYANGHNMFVLTSNNPSSNQTGVWKDVVYYLGGYWDGNTSGTWKDLIMASPTDDSGNSAELRHVTVASGAEFKIHMHYQTSDGTSHEYWFGHCETGYGFLNYNEGKTNSRGGDASFTDTYNNGVFSSSLEENHNSYSFYFKNGIIYIEDDYNESAAGYLYFANASSAEDIRVTAVNSSSETVLSNVRITAVSGTSSAGDLVFNGIRGVHKISLYNLRGNATNKYISSLEIHIGAASKTYTWAAATSGNPSIYIDFDSTVQDSSAKGPAAALAFEVAKNIASASNHSVCNITKATATALCQSYDGLSSDAKTDFLSSKVYTWNSTKDTYAGEKDWAMDKILWQISNICDDGVSRGTKPASAWHVGSMHKEESPLTMTLWIVLGAGLVGLTAIGAAYFISKKRKRV